MDRQGRIHPCFNLTLETVESLVKRGSIRFRTQEPLPTKYEISDRLCGVGGFKRVYLARVKGDHPKLAMCSIMNTRGLEGGKLRIKNELRILQNMHHPNIVQLFDVQFDKTNEDIYIVCEYAPYGDLKNFARLVHKQRGGVLPSRVVNLTMQILRGIEYLHDHWGIIHRDIKPENILIFPDNVCKIIDFGLATKMTNPLDPRTEKPRLVRYQSIDPEAPEGHFSGLGTTIYMAPEMLLGRRFAEFNSTIDIYSFGFTFVYLLTTKLPFSDRKPVPIDSAMDEAVYQNATLNIYKQIWDLTKTTELKDSETDDRDQKLRMKEITKLKNTVVERELAKFAFIPKISKWPHHIVPDMEEINKLFNRLPMPHFPNRRKTYLDLFRDCVGFPSDRLSAKEIQIKYFIESEMLRDPFSPDFQGQYMSIA